MRNFERPFAPRGWLRSACNFRNMYFRMSPTFHFDPEQQFLVLRTYRRPSLDVWLDVSKYVLFKWCCHSASTYVHMIPRVRLRESMYSEFHIAKKSWKKDSQIYRKSFKNRPLGPPWDACGATWAPLGKHFGHLFPKDWILETWRRVLGVQKGQVGSNLEAQDAPKQNPKCEKSMLKNNTFLASIFLISQT